MGAFRKAALVLGAGLITAGAGTIYATHKSNGIRDQIDSRSGISKCIANHVADKRVKKSVGEVGHRVYKDLSKNPAKGYGSGLGAIAIGLPTFLEGASSGRKRKQGGGLPAASYLDVGLENKNDTHYIDDIDTPTRAIKLYPVRDGIDDSGYVALRLAA
jgi:hypothetical protein